MYYIIYIYYRSEKNKKAVSVIVNNSSSDMELSSPTPKLLSLFQEMEDKRKYLKLKEDLTELKLKKQKIKDFLLFVLLNLTVHDQPITINTSKNGYRLFSCRKIYKLWLF